MRRLGGVVVALLLSLVPATADMGGGNHLNGFGANVASSGVTKIPLPTLTRGTCVVDTANATTYNSAGFQATGTGADDLDSVLVVVGISGEDNAAAFDCTAASTTIDGAAATEIVDEDGSGIINTCLYRTSGVATGRAAVNVSVTFSEALAGSATVCAWALKDLITVTPDSFIQDDDTASGALVLTTATTVAPGFVVGMCATQDTGVSTTWAVISEVEDGANGEHDFSNADGASTGASMANTCDWSGTGDASGVAAAFH
jgi:hypothetical protein